jgi:hypothetical protein
MADDASGRQFAKSAGRARVYHAVGYQTIRAALMNPVKSLKAE